MYNRLNTLLENTYGSRETYNSKKGYDFYFKDGADVLLFPITPSELTIKIGSNNKVITLINEGDINVLKSPSLMEVEFDARFPMRQYPYAKEFHEFQTYWDKFKELKENRKSFRFIVSRTTPKGKRTWDTNILVALEDITLNESVDEGDDVIVSFSLKQYKEYSVKTIRTTTTDETTSTSTSDTPRPTENKSEDSSVYVVQTGDCLWNIAKAAYGDGSKYTVIYEANKSVIEEAARQHGRSASSNGYIIYAGTKLTIPGISDASKLNVTKLK